MSRSFTFVDHTADIAVSLEGSSLEELFTAGAESYRMAITDETNLVTDDVRETEITADSLEELLITFLNENF